MTTEISAICVNDDFVAQPVFARGVDQGPPTGYGEAAAATILAATVRGEWRLRGIAAHLSADDGRIRHRALHAFDLQVGPQKRVTGRLCSETCTSRLEIGARYGISKMRVSQILIRYGVQRRGLRKEANGGGPNASC